MAKVLVLAFDALGNDRRMHHYEVRVPCDEPVVPTLMWYVLDVPAEQCTLAMKVDGEDPK